MTVKFALFDGVYGKDIAYTIVDDVFSRKLFTMVTWSGFARNDIPKECFSQFTSTIHFFHDLVHTADNRMTMAASIRFLKEMIQNSDRRYKAWLKSVTGGNKRESRCKRRTVCRKKIIIDIVPPSTNNVVDSPATTNNNVPVLINNMIEPNNVTEAPDATNSIVESAVESTIQLEDHKVAI